MMSMNLELALLATALFCAVALAVVGTVAGLEIRRLRSRLKWHEERLAWVERELVHLGHALGSQKGQIGEASRQLDAVFQRQEQIELTPSRPLYEDAVALVRQGASTERLMDACGLSRGEADLVRSLHGAHAA